MTLGLRLKCPVVTLEQRVLRNCVVYKVPGHDICGCNFAFFVNMGFEERKDFDECVFFVKCKQMNDITKYSIPCDFSSVVITKNKITNVNPNPRVKQELSCYSNAHIFLRDDDGQYIHEEEVDVSHAWGEKELSTKAPCMFLPAGENDRYGVFSSKELESLEIIASPSGLACNFKYYPWYCSHVDLLHCDEYAYNRHGYVSINDIELCITLMCGVDNRNPAKEHYAYHVF